MHYLITGGAGFIGSNLSKTLLRTDPSCRVTCIDNLDPMYDPAIKKVNIGDLQKEFGQRFQQLSFDISIDNLSGLNAQIAVPVNIIIHLAAKAGVRPSIQDPVSYQKTNVVGLQNLLDYARDNKIEQFVFASSSSVYGVNPAFPWKEDEKLLPISPYGMTKLAGEILGHVYHHLYGIRFIGLRFFTVYGPGQRPDLAIHKFTKAIITGQTIQMYGDGTTSRDYTYIDDTVRGIIAATKYKDSGYEIFNLGNNYSVTLTELISQLEKVCSKKAIISRQPEQPGDVPLTFADITKAKQKLGYQPSTNLEEGLKKFYDWFVANQDLLLR